MKNPNATGSGPYQTKLSILLGHMSAGRWDDALRLANSFANLGNHAERIRRAWNAMQRPQFYRELGHDVDALIADGQQALRERYQQDGDDQ